jgi:hypothetical protein
LSAAPLDPAQLGTVAQFPSLAEQLPPPTALAAHAATQEVPERERALAVPWRLLVVLLAAVQPETAARFRSRAVLQVQPTAMVEPQV